MPDFNISISGVDKVLRRLDQATKQETVNKIDRRVEAVTRKMANDAATNAPVDSGKLRNSIIASPEKVGDMMWQFGSDLPYAKRQEYENATKKAFIRKAVWSNEKKLKEGVLEEIRKI
jgi:hypothetical protein